jgi:hypothetical protein
MRIIPTPEIKKMMDMVKPYEEGCHLRSDAPDEIRDMDRKVRDWYHNAFQEVEDLCLI